MLAITEYSVELIKDPFGILSGKRYEFILDLDVPEDDELHSEHGVYAKVVYKADEERSGIITCDLYERTTHKFLDIDVEDDEKAEFAAFCKDNLPED
ncbi:DUF6509 family protein [Cohnella yongneupensis]|uniref:DUF6509 family protein n=1 Tax=Cohnella yongneupensis TaxID=425006 RepID=A0ABW0R1G0_9BACL